MENTLRAEQEKKDMNRVIEALRRLQSINDKVRRLKKDKEYRRMDAEEKRRQITQKQTALAEKQNEIKTFQKTIDTKELDLKTKDAEIQKLQGQLNSAKTNKEYSALLLEIRGHEADNSVIEDETLKMFAELESKEAGTRELVTEIAREEKQFNEQLQTMETEIVSLDKEIEALQKDEERFLELVDDEEARHHYKRLSSHRDGIAVVGVSNHACNGCNMGLTAQTLNLLMARDKLVFCNNCGRILYLDESELK